MHYEKHPTMPEAMTAIGRLLRPSSAPYKRRVKIEEIRHDAGRKAVWDDVPSGDPRPLLESAADPVAAEALRWLDSSAWSSKPTQQAIECLALDLADGDTNGAGRRAELLLGRLRAAVRTLPTERRAVVSEIPAGYEVGYRYIDTSADYSAKGGWA